MTMEQILTATAAKSKRKVRRQPKGRIRGSAAARIERAVELAAIPFMGEPVTYETDDNISSTELGLN